MSVINQVLNQLEQRGVDTAAEQTMVRAVPHGRRNWVKPVLLAGLALAAGIAAWQWLSRKPVAVETNAMPKTAGSVEMAVAQVAISENPPARTFMPASRLSLELSSLPATPRQGRNPVTPRMEEIVVKTANDAPMKRVSLVQRADAEFRKAADLMQQGRVSDAITGYETALRLDASHEAARQAMVALLLEGKRNADAEKVLQEGVKGKPENIGFTMLLARLQVERGALEQATATLEKSLPFAEARADYQAFLAALLQRQNRHKEAVERYQNVLKLSPGNGVWLMGYGISLQAVGRNAEAKETFQRALATQTLNLELQAFVQQRIKEL